MKRCKSCNKIISQDAQRCSHCAKIGELNHRFKNFPRKYCIDCGKELSKRANYYNYKRCGSCARKEVLKDPKNHPCYIDGRSFIEYNSYFKRKVRFEILKRDNYVCKNCGIINKIHLKRYKRGLHVHHIDYNKKNNIKNNLITLCTKCNTKANKNRSYWKKYFKKLLKIGD